MSSLSGGLETGTWKKVLPSLAILPIAALLGWVVWFSLQLLQALPWPQIDTLLKLLDSIAIALYTVQLFFKL